MRISDWSSDVCSSDLVREDDLPDVLAAIRQQSGLVRGAFGGTMLRNDGYNFSRIGTFLERADNTARILAVKYYLLLPSVAHIGTSIDNEIGRASCRERVCRYV